MQRPRMHRTTCQRRAWPLAAAAGALAFCGGSGDSRAAPTCTATSCPADFIALESPQIQTTTTSFKFQARVSQAKLPVDDVQFPKVIVNLRQANKVWCSQTLTNVKVRESVLNIEVGPTTGMTCSTPMEEVIASQGGLGFQICINNEENCLKPIALSSVPYAVKAEFARRAQQAHEADVAAQCHYAHRMAADVDLLKSPTIGTGYFDFHTPPQSTAVDGFSVTNQEGVMQWAPVAGNRVLNVCLKTPANGAVAPGLDRLDALRLHAAETVARGKLFVTEETTLHGVVRTEDDLSVDGVTQLGDALNVSGATTLRSGLGVTGPATLNNSLTVTGPTTLQSTLVVQGAEMTTFQGPVTFENEVNLALPVGAMTAESLTVTGQSTLGPLTASSVGTPSISAQYAQIIKADIESATFANVVNFSEASFETANFRSGLTMGSGRHNIFFGAKNKVADNVTGATISGGGDIWQPNEVSRDYATVSGGRGNVAGELYAAVGGGQTNTASGQYATVGGGLSNTGSASAVTVGGGENNVANQDNATVGGGKNNTAGALFANAGMTGEFCTVGGGENNTASALAATIGGGQSNIASAIFTTVAGGQANTASEGRATVAGGGSNTASGEVSTIGGGQSNTASALFTTVGGGNYNEARAEYATISGGGNNHAKAEYATVGGGYLNTASADRSTIGGGSSNKASGSDSTIGGGRSNTASAPGATVVGGGNNTASSMYATVAGGQFNVANGNGSFAAGFHAHANDPGSFVWGDSSSATNVGSAGPNTFSVRATGGVFFYTTTSAMSFVALPAGGGSWISVSDRNQKLDIQEIDPETVVAALEGMPVSTWRYNNEQSRALHMGPTAQDFYAAFGLGDTDKGISTIDGQGVALAGVKGVHSLVKRQAAKIEEQSAKIDSLTQDLDALRGQSAEMEQRLARLESRLDARPAWRGATMYGGAAGSLVLIGIAAVLGRRRKNACSRAARD